MRSAVHLTRNFSETQGAKVGVPRKPLPPMPRVLPLNSTVEEASAASSSSFLARSWKNGNLLLGIGWSCLAVIVIDRYLQYQQASEKRDARQMMLAIKEETATMRRVLFEENKDRPTLFQCVVREEYKNMGGTHGLKDVKKNEIVDVLEEGVGPDGFYNLCRIYSNAADGGERTIKSIGWYPIQFLEKIDPSKTKPGILKRLMGRS